MKPKTMILKATWEKVDPKVLEAAFTHFQKLLTYDQFVITGSYALYQFHLMDKCTDLDIILVKPDEASLAILEKLRVPATDDYPVTTDQFRIDFNGLNIDFFVKSKPIETLQLQDGRLLSYPNDIAKAKQQYNSLKQVLQLKKIAAKFYVKKQLKQAIKNLSV